MSSQVEFFCSAREERALWLFLESRGAVFRDVVCDASSDWLGIEDLMAPPWGEPCFLIAWARDYGDLVWHGERPVVDTATHAVLVASLSAQSRWGDSKPSDWVRALDTEHSPIVYLKRPGVLGGRRSPNSVLAPASRIDRVGLDYAAWVGRVVGWARRRGQIVHDYRTPSDVIHNPLSLLNTIYALPDVQESVATSPGNFVIMSS